MPSLHDCFSVSAVSKGIISALVLSKFVHSFIPFYFRLFSSRFYRDRRGGLRLETNSAADMGKRGEFFKQKSATPIIIDLLPDSYTYNKIFNTIFGVIWT